MLYNFKIYFLLVEKNALHKSSLVYHLYDKIQQQLMMCYMIFTFLYFIFYFSHQQTLDSDKMSQINEPRLLLDLDISGNQDKVLRLDLGKDELKSLINKMERIKTVSFQYHNALKSLYFLWPDIFFKYNNAYDRRKCCQEQPQCTTSPDLIFLLQKKQKPKFRILENL